MASSPQQWGRNVRDHARRFAEMCDQAPRKIVLELHRDVTLRTPVDTGHARWNNQVAVDALPGSEAVKPGVDVFGDATVAETTPLVLGTPNSSRLWFIFNPVPYALALEYGHSKQAPGGMYRLAIERYRPVVAKVAKDLRSLSRGLR